MVQMEVVMSQGVPGLGLWGMGLKANKGGQRMWHLLYPGLGGSVQIDVYYLYN